MTFDNSRTIISLRIKLFVATVLLLAYLAIAYAAKLIEFPVLGLDDTIWTLILIGLYLLNSIYPMVRNFQYVSFSDEDENIVFRYFFAGIVGGKKNSISINKQTFAGYKAETEYFGLRRSITLFQKVGKNIAKYPPVHISAITREQREKLFNCLNKYSPKV
jgi:hypothetical protein